MKKALIAFGLLILIAVLLVNRLAFELSAVFNILLCILAAILIVAGILVQKRA